MFDRVKSLLTDTNQAGIVPWLLVLSMILVPTAGKTSAPARGTGASAQKARVVEGYGKLPLAFEANRGQTDAEVKFLCRGAGYSLFLTSSEAVLTLGRASQEETGLLTTKALALKHRPAKQEKPTVLRMKLLGANAKTEVTGQDELPGKSNYIFGNDRKRWHTNVPQYAKVRYANVYRGVDLVYYGNQRELEYDFVVQPGADPNAIRIGIEGAKRLRIEGGDLVMTSAAGDVRLRSPRIYQEGQGLRPPVTGRYVMRDKNEVGFEVDTYDHRQALVIDPVLSYSTSLGLSAVEAHAIAVDFDGNAYVTGKVWADGFPTANAFQTNYAGNTDSFVTKLNADGTSVVYSTYLGGSGFDEAYAIAVDSTGAAYVTGSTDSTDFPVVNAIQTTYHRDVDAFVTKFSANGTALVYSTYLGGNGFDNARDIAVDSMGIAYVTGGTTSTNFPSRNAIQPENRGGDSDGFVAVFNAEGKRLVYSTYLGGSGYDTASGIAVDTAGNAYVAGSTYSLDFPVVNAVQPVSGGGGDVFVTKIKFDGSALEYSTYLGGSGFEGTNWYGLRSPSIAVDAAGNAYVTAGTTSVDFPTVNAIQPSFGGGVVDAFVSKINTTGSALMYSTYLGGRGEDSASDIAVDALGNVFVSGPTGSCDFPTVNAIQTWRWGCINYGPHSAFVTDISASGANLVYSTYLGGVVDTGGSSLAGIAVDLEGSAYVVGSGVASTPVPFKPLSFGGPSIAKIALGTFVHRTPQSLFFPAQVIGTTSAAKTFTVRNLGSNPLSINQVFVGGLNAGDFAETNTCGSVLGARATCQVFVTFSPMAKNLRSAGVAISSSDPGSPSAVGLEGRGTVVAFSQANLNFGSYPVGTSSAPQKVVLTNAGSWPLYINPIFINGRAVADYSQTNTCPVWSRHRGAALAAGASCTITVTFKPTLSGMRKAAVIIVDDGGASPQQIALTGTGT